MGNIRRMTRKRLGELLLQEGLINDEHLELALEEQKQTGELIGEILVRKGYVTESDIARTISTQFSFPYLSVSRYYIAPEMEKLFSLEQLEKNLFVPIDRFGDVLSIVVAGLLDQDVMDGIEKETDSSIQVYVGTVSEVKTVIKEKFAGGGAGAKGAKPGHTAAKPAKAADKEEDVTAPPAKAAAKKAPADGEAKSVTESAGDESAPEGTAEKADEKVVEELEQQFKKFKFFEDEAKGGKKEEEKK